MNNKSRRVRVGKAHHVKQHKFVKKKEGAIKKVLSAEDLLYILE